MKIKYYTPNLDNHPGKNYLEKKMVYEFEIAESILKTHYKSLARMAHFFKYNHGFIDKKDEADFLALVEKIEKSSDKRAAASHKKAIESKKNRDNDRKVKERCDHADLGSLGYRHGEWVKCPMCGKMCEVW